MTPQEFNEIILERDELKKELGLLKTQIYLAATKERELRSYISYLNKLGPKPAVIP